MKTSLISIIITVAVLFCGCATSRSTGRTNGILQVSYHVPEDLAGRRISTYFNGECLASGTGTSATFTLRPRHFIVRVEMDGAKPFEQTLDVPGNGSQQVLDVTLVKQ
jgi:Mn2+/Fe2+ NRAMP family transporter